MYEHADLVALLPHRHPILLVDRVIACRPGELVRAVKTISGSEPCYADLAAGPSAGPTACLPSEGPTACFTPPPSSYRYPPSLLLESLVQAAGVLWAATTRRDGRALDGTLVLGAVRDVTFHRQVFPGDTLHHTVELDRVVGSNAFCTGRTELHRPGLSGDGSVVMTVRQLVLAMRPAHAIAGGA